MNQNNKYSRYRALSVNQINEELGFEIDVINNMIKSVENSKARDELRLYFHEKAISDSIKANYNRTYVVLDYIDYQENGFNLEETRIYGLFTLSMNTIDIKDIGKNKRKKLFGGSSFHGIDHINELPTMLIGRLMKNESVEHQDKFFQIVFTLIEEIHKEVNTHAALSFLSLDCAPEVYDKVYKRYGFKLINNSKEYYSCGMNIYR
ncbi:MAG: hypothetical protein ACK5NF_07800 [Bacilli bacterium]